MMCKCLVIHASDGVSHNLPTAVNFWATVCKMVHPMRSHRSVLSCLWRWCIVAKRVDGSRWIWHAGRPRPWPHCVKWGPSSPPQKGGSAPTQFSAHVYCAQTAAWIKMPLGIEVGLGSRCYIVLDGDPGPFPKRGHSPQFLAHVCCGQTPGWIKMPL